MCQSQVESDGLLDFSSLRLAKKVLIKQVGTFLTSMLVNKTY